MFCRTGSTRTHPIGRSPITESTEAEAPSIDPFTRERIAKLMHLPDEDGAAADAIDTAARALLTYRRSLYEVAEAIAKGLQRYVSYDPALLAMVKETLGANAPNVTIESIRDMGVRNVQLMADALAKDVVNRIADHLADENEIDAEVCLHDRALELSNVPDDAFVVPCHVQELYPLADGDLADTCRPCPTCDESRVFRVWRPKLAQSAKEAPFTDRGPWLECVPCAVWSDLI